jgi:hypothetical protein
MDLRTTWCLPLDKHHHDLSMPILINKRPRDANQFAKLIIDLAAREESPDNLPSPRAENPTAVALGKLGGNKGGAARAQKLSAEDRRRIAINGKIRDGSGS